MSIFLDLFALISSRKPNGLITLWYADIGVSVTFSPKMLNGFNNSANVSFLPTSTTWEMEAGQQGNVASSQIAYCFHSVDGYSKVGTYTGNGVNLNGPFVYTGFRPAYVMIKRTDSADPWVIFDSAREPENEDDGQDLSLKANASDAEASYGNIDLLSNGFKVMINAGYMNNSGSPYIYLAFAEHPFKHTNAR